MRSIAQPVLALAAAAGVALALAPAAQQPTPGKTGKKAAPPAAKVGEGPADAKAADRVNAVERITEAYRLMELAEANKLPEVYVGAARLFLLLDKNKVEPTPLDSTPEVLTEDDKAAPPAKDAAPTTQTFKQLAETCFDAADALADKQKRGAAITGLIGSIRENPETGADARGALGGPRSVVRVIGGHQKHVHRIDFDTRTPGSIGFTASLPLRCHMEWNTYVHFNQVVRTGAYSWRPSSNVGPVKRYTITVHNGHDGPAQYRLFTN